MADYDGGARPREGRGRGRGGGRGRGRGLGERGRGGQRGGARGRGGQRGAGYGQGRQRGGEERAEGDDIPDRPRGPPRLGYNRLKQLLEENPDNILMSINRNIASFTAILVYPMKNDWTNLVLAILSKSCQSHMSPQTLVHVLTMVHETDFIDRIIPHQLREMTKERYVAKQETFVKPIKDVFELCSQMLQRILNHAYDKVFICLGTMETVIRLLRAKTNIIDDEIEEKFEELQKLLEDSGERIERRGRTGGRGTDEQPPDDFRTIQVAPRRADLIIRSAEEAPFLRENLAKGKYKSVDHYLDVQFRLLREDFVRPLRDGLKEYRRHYVDMDDRRAKLQNVRVYTDVQIIRPVCTNNGLTYRIRFNTKHLKNIKWRVSKRLIFGSLLCLSRDNFTTLIFATVSDRKPEDLEKLGELEIKFEDFNEDVAGAVRNLEISYTMLETSAYFEAYRHVLRGLQNTTDENMPFKKYIVDCEADVKPPAYLTRRSLYDFRPIMKGTTTEKILDDVDDADGERENGENAMVSYKYTSAAQFSKNIRILDDLSWPTAEQLGVDDSQLRALKTCLTKEFSVVQGPPGTGKTYIGLKVIEVLLHNRAVWSRGPNVHLPRDKQPILVVCYTNHALDQFLEEVTKFCPENLVRVGGRSTCQALKKYTLRTLRYNAKEKKEVPRNIHDGLRAAFDDMKSIQNDLETTVKKSEVVEHGIIHEIHLERHMCEDHWSSLFEMASYSPRVCMMAEWLGYGKSSLSHYPEPEGPPPSDDEETDETEDEEMDVEGDLDFIEEQRMLDDEVNDYNIKTKAVAAGMGILGLEAAEVGRQIPEDDGWTRETNPKKQREQLKRQLKSTDAMREEEVLAVRHLEMEILGLEAAEVGRQMPEDDGWTRATNPKKQREQLKRQLKSTDAMREEEVLAVRHLWQLDYPDRWRLYRFWIRKYLEEVNHNIEREQQMYSQAAARMREARDQEDLAIMRTATVIGMTTTGAAKYRSSLQEIQPKIVIVEEAAEVLESHIITSLSARCQHVILIGDHKQLRPSTAVYDLAKNFNLEISLFERMVNNGLHLECLQYQHRMRPEISDLIRFVYPTLLDHEDVKKYDEIKGVSTNMFFINHRELEKEDIDSRSHSNKHEAEYITRLCKHLLLQGYAPTQITVMTPYTGQLFTFKKVMDKKTFDGVRITVVDNYQGEENDIILLSLVRSNVEGKLGFLSIQNRICVALSRAKKAMFVIGNFEMMVKNCADWSKIVSCLTKNRKFGSHLMLQCRNHSEITIPTAFASDFNHAPEGGCSKPCEHRLTCGHQCPSACHVTNADHKLTKCCKPCGNRCPGGHRCQKKCYEECECNERLVKRLPRCSHLQEVYCYEDVHSVICRSPCDRYLPCGLHRCQKKCYEECGSCQERLVKRLPRCSHLQEVYCYEDVDGVICISPCDRYLPCGHKCQKKCYEECGSCKERLEKVLPRCSHLQEVYCYEDVDSVICLSPYFACGHKCGNTCGEAYCKVATEKTWPCGCVNRTECHVDVTNVPCPTSCGELLKCEHPCPGTCGKCLQGRIHVACQQKCGRTLVCGHICTFPCTKDCPPCEQKCENCCVHSKCSKKCGAPCIPCNEPCQWNCRHHQCSRICKELCDRPRCDEPCRKRLRCQHRCIGLCGEQCPTLCMVCNRDEVLEVFFGTEEEDARFIQLDDCGHVLEVTAMDQWMDAIEEASGPNGISIQMKKCPKCSKPIRKHLRYGNIVKQTLKDIEAVKVRNAGNQHEIEKKGNGLYRKLLTLRLDAYGAKSDMEQKLFNPHVTLATLNLIENTIEFLQHLARVRKNINTSLRGKDSGQSLATECDVVEKRLLEIRQCASDQQLDDFNLEITRLMKVTRLTAYVAKLEDMKWKDLLPTATWVSIEKTFAEVKKGRRFDTEELDQVIKDVEKDFPKTGLRLSDDERVMIVKVMGLSQGHWYKCPNGHVYAISECGGAMEEGRCPDCKADWWEPSQT